MPRRKKEDLPQEEIKKIKTPPLVKGMKDVLPADERYWDVVEEQIRNIVRDYSYKRLRTPALEKYELFNHTLFRQFGLFEKEAFSFIDKGEKLVMRPELSVSAARAFLEHNMSNQPMPVKLYDWGPVFRQGRVRPDKYRQHTQASFSIWGDKSPAIDAELIIVASYFLKNLGLETEIRLNSLGCQVCRLEYAKALSGYLKAKRAAICPDCRKRAVKDPLKFLSCRNARCLRVKEDAPQTVDWLCDECRNQLFRVLEYLDELKLSYNLDSSLVNHYDYYMKNVFELTAASSEGEPVVLAYGGRYDYLIEMLGGERTPGVGFTVELEKVVNRMKTDKVELPAVKGPDVFVAQISESARKKAFAFFEELRHQGFYAKANLARANLKAQLDMAKKAGAQIVLILGQKEVSEGTVFIRDVESGIQEVIDQKKAVSEIRKRIK